MKKKLRRILIIFTFLGFIFACQQDISLNVTKSSGKLQVLSILSPDFDKPEVFVSMLYPELSPEGISGAKVTLSDSNFSITLKWKESGLYQNESEFRIDRNKVYHLNVATGEHVFQAQTKIPDEPQFLELVAGDTLEMYMGRYERKIPLLSFTRTTGAVSHILTVITQNDGEIASSHVKVDSLSAQLPIPYYASYAYIDTILYRPARLQLWACDSAATKCLPDIDPAVADLNTFGSVNVTELPVFLKYDINWGE